MFERFTVDVLAEHVPVHLLEGDPTPKLAHRFFRKGRRDGKRGYGPASVKKLLVDAVRLAGSTLAEELVARLAENGRTMAESEAQLKTAKDVRAAVQDGPPGNDLSAQASPAAPSPMQQAGVGGGSAALLTQASDERRRVRSAGAARQRAAERAAKLQAAEDRAQQALVTLARLAREREELPGEYQQRFESVEHTGELLWSRYCNGFVQGKCLRGSRSVDIDAPGGTLDVPMPQVFATGSVNEAMEGEVAR